MIQAQMYQPRIPIRGGGGHIDLRERAGENPIVAALEKIIAQKRQKEQDELTRRMTEARIGQMEQPEEGQIVIADGKTWLVDRRTGEKRDLGIAPPQSKVEDRNVSDIINEIAKISGAAEKVPEDVLETPIVDAALGPLRKEAMGKAGLEEVKRPGEKRSKLGIDWLAKDVPPRTEIRKKTVLPEGPRKKATRKAKIRSWIVPFNKKYGKRLQPSVLDKMDDEFIDRLSSLSTEEREAELQKLSKEAPGKTRPPKPKEYPDAKWSEEHQMWTIVKNGRLMGVK